MPGSFRHLLQPSRVNPWFAALALWSVCLWNPTCWAEDNKAVRSFHEQIEPILEEKCFDCHAYGMQEGSVAFDGFASTSELVSQPELWYRALRMVRAGLMPPAEMPRLSTDQMHALEKWIKAEVFQANPQEPDPGHVVLRRLNRVEYRNTIRDLLGVDYDTQTNFPADDSGHGFDNVGEVLTVSPLLLEKYLAAAREIVAQAVPLPADNESEVRSSKKYKEIFPEDVPTDVVERKEYTRKLLRDFATRAYRRPVDDETVDRLVAVAERATTGSDETFEFGISQAMTAVLASPRFLYRQEFSRLPTEEEKYAVLDDWSLASRLSYFVWSTMPDAELFQLAAADQLHGNLLEQFDRLMQDSRSQAFIRNFVGQWLRARDIDTVIINGPEVMRRDQPPVPDVDRLRDRFRELHCIPDEDLTELEREELDSIRQQFRSRFKRFEEFELNGRLRHAMRRETEMTFERILREDRSLLELLNADYTYLNERLARHYGIDGVSGNQMRLVQLPLESPRGGVLTQGTVLAITSNPGRTSPVKRGLFILDNLLGTPPPPPPPNIPALEDAGTKDQQRAFTVAEALAVHRSEPMCSSCHNRMDPLGLALENFNALGLWREKERGQPISASGQLITGEQFGDVRELKRVLVENHRLDFYRCVTEKMLVYALGRGLDYHDVETVDQIVARLEETGGRPSALLHGIVSSFAFQKTRKAMPVSVAAGKSPPREPARH